MSRTLVLHRSLAVGAMLSVALWTGIGRAQSSEALATEFFEKGKTLEADGKASDACDAFQQSAELDPTVGALAKVAGCHEAEGDLAAARGAWQRARALASAQSDERMKAIEQEFNRLDKIVPRVRIVLEDASIQRFDVWIDNVELTNVNPGIGIPVNPGKVSIRVLVAGYEPWTTVAEVQGEPGATEIVVSGLVEVRPEPELIPAGAGNPLLPVGWTLVGVGGVGLIGGSVFGLLTLDRKSTADAECDDELRVCSQSGRDAADQGSTFGMLTTIGWTVGALALGAGLFIVLTPEDDAPEATDAEQDATVRLGFGTDEGPGLSVFGRF